MPGRPRKRKYFQLLLPGTEAGLELGQLLGPDGVTEVPIESEEIECKPPTPRTYTQLLLPGTTSPDVKFAAAEI